MKTIFKQSTLSIIIVAALITPPAYSANTKYKLAEINADKKVAQTKEEIGFGSGALIGAIFGGPIGALVTGIAGNFIAKHANAKDNIENLELALVEEKSINKQTVSKYQQKLQHSEQLYQAELLSLEQKQQNASQLQAENLMMSLQFPSGSSELQPHYQGQIVALAQMLENSPRLLIDLSGYTDLQGNESLNHALSIARVNSVKNALVDNGIESDRIKLYAFGEQDPVVANSQKEVSFYDRRVVIKLHSQIELNDQTANNY